MKYKALLLFLFITLLFLSPQAGRAEPVPSEIIYTAYGLDGNKGLLQPVFPDELIKPRKEGAVSTAVDTFTGEAEKNTSSQALKKIQNRITAYSAFAVSA